jgi:hypothetical protein
MLYRASSVTGATGLRLPAPVLLRCYRGGWREHVHSYSSVSASRPAQPKRRNGRHEEERPAFPFHTDDVPPPCWHIIAGGHPQRS